MDFSDSATKVTGIRTINLTNVATFDNTAAHEITFAADNNSVAYGSGPITVSFSPATTAGALTGLNTQMAGTGTSDALTVSLGALASGVTNGIDAGGFETLTISSARAAGSGVTIGAITVDNAPGSQTVKISGAGNFTLGNVGGDVVDLSGVTGTVAGPVALTNATGVVFTGGIGATAVTGTGSPDIITTGAGADTIITGNATSGGDQVFSGAGNDTITGGTGADRIDGGDGADNITGGAGADTLTGGNGADTFLIVANGDTGPSGTAALTSGLATASLDVIVDIAN